MTAVRYQGWRAAAERAGSVVVRETADAPVGKVWGRALALKVGQVSPTGQVFPIARVFRAFRPARVFPAVRLDQVFPAPLARAAQLSGPPRALWSTDGPSALSHADRCPFG